MVDVGAKPVTRRRAVAEAFLEVPLSVMAELEAGRTPKGNIDETARLAGIAAAKRTAELIPLCHLLLLDHVDVVIERRTDSIRIEATVSCRGPTGVEMEALTAASVAALTLYDMLKGLSHDLRIRSVRLLRKSGGLSGEYIAPGPGVGAGPPGSDELVADPGESEERP